MRLIDLTGMRFGRLEVIKRGENIGRSAAFECRCDCGTMLTARAASLRNGDTASCGCYRAEKMAEKQRKHGHFGSRTYNSWASMLSRCRDKNKPAYARYGAIGITVCERWEKFENFLADMGERPEGCSIDRIDNDKGYEPGNCRWATPIQQRRNQRRYIARHGDKNV